jgi:peroxiredoxin
MTEERAAAGRTLWGPRLRRWALASLAAVGSLLLVHWWHTRDLPAGPAPALEGRLVTGGRTALTELRGRPVLVRFWGSWCPICRAENPNITAVAEDFQVLTVAMHSGEAGTVREHLAGEGLAFPTVADPDGEIATAWGVSAVPATFVIDPEGGIRFRAVGYTTELGLRLRLWWAGRF